jgi:exodeoxyribonuclease V alpha subunit
MQRKIRVTGAWYVGRPILITENNATLQLYNGDIGLCLREDEKLLVCFQQPDGSIKRYLPSRITACETVFAMTIHKSQGSEFEEVCVLLPEVSNAVLTKELLYTAITRAKETVTVVATSAVFMTTVQRKVERVTGLVMNVQNSN